MAEDERLPAADVVEAMLDEIGVELPGPAQKKLAKALATQIEDMGGSKKKFILRMASEELASESFFPAISAAGWSGDEAEMTALCLRAVTVGGFQKKSESEPEASDEPLTAPEGLEQIWTAIQTLDAADFAALQGELGELIVERGLGALRYFPPGSKGPGQLEPEPEPTSASDTLSAALMKDAAVQARKAQQERASKLEAAAPEAVDPLKTVEELLSVTLDEDIREYVDGTASGMRDDVKDGGMEKDEAVEELLAVLEPLLEGAGADESALEAQSAAIRTACEALVSPPEPKAEAADAAAPEPAAEPAAEVAPADPMATLEELLSVTLDEDIREYLDGTASGMRDDVKDGGMEKDEAAEELLAVMGPMLEQAGADESALETHDAALRTACEQLVSPPAPAPKAVQAKPRKTLREQVDANKIEDWRLSGVGQAKFAMDQVGLSAQEALRAKERAAQKRELTPAQIAARKRKEEKEQAIRDKFEEEKMAQLLARKDEKCAFSFEKVEVGEGPGALTVSGLQFKYDNSKELLRDSKLQLHSCALATSSPQCCPRIPSSASMVLSRACCASGRRYGLIGRNGEGKSSLLRILPELAPEGMRIHVVHQEAEGDSKTSALEAVIASDEARVALLAEEEKLQESDKPDLARLAEIADELVSMDAHSAEGRAASILSGLQFTEEMQAGPTERLSGGWRMRLALASALFMKPDLLCLDEPTNHLDLYACLWLEEYLAEWPTTLLCVAHDVTFLNEVATDIVHLCNQQVGPSF